MGSQVPIQRNQKRVLKEVISFRIEEEIGSDGKTISTRTMISSRPIIYRIWIKNSTHEGTASFFNFSSKECKSQKRSFRAEHGAI